MKTYICGIPISVEKRSDVLITVDKIIKDKEYGNYISITNTEAMWHALRNKDHAQYVNNACYSFCDGVGVIAAGLFWGNKIQRFNGPIVMLELCKYGVTQGWRHFFYGGKEGIAEKLIDNLSKMFPGMITAGYYCPPFKQLSKEEDEKIVKIINDAKPDIVWVGLGLPKQEAWIAAHLHNVKAPWMIGVGGAFDYHSGAVKWAPVWIRSIGMEWLFRLVLQPKLRAKRNWWSLLLVIEASCKGIAYQCMKLFNKT